jgi:hypothetical protein
MTQDPQRKPERPRREPTPAQQAAATIADGLGEHEHVPRAQVSRVVHVLGIERALAFYAQAQVTEAAGGMLLPDGSRRRTPGGVFFRLVRDGIAKEERWRIFPSHTQRQQSKQQTASAPHQAAGALLITDLPNLTGEARTVKITLIGRPGRVTLKPDYVLTTMQSTTVPALPKGLPAPPQQPTVYTVYMAFKQWTKVAEALRNPEDALILEGTPVYDPELEGIAVYVTNATTKVLQQAQRATQQQ